MAKIFTVDVEEYFHAENILKSLTDQALCSMPSRIRVGVDKILKLLEKTGSQATFFVLGCVAEKNKGLIQRIHEAGHEIASHGYRHVPLHEHTPFSFAQDLSRSVKILSDITGEPVLGYRATSFSLTEKVGWFFDILRKHHMVYDSSVSTSFFRPSFHFDSLKENSDCFEISEGLWEFPIASMKIGPLRLPMGGGYFRAYPYEWTRWGLHHTGANGHGTTLFYVHPWELDPEQPKLRIPFVRFWRHYLNLHTTECKLDQLLKDIRFTSIRDAMAKRQAAV